MAAYPFGLSALVRITKKVKIPINTVGRAQSAVPTWL
jgi:hypothetical protein